jgi:hypothetical protein
MRKADALNPRTLTASVELVLRLADGTPWRLSMSPGMECFIGSYPRVDGIDCGGPLLSFRIADSA